MIKSDVSIAKNYLSESEMKSLERTVSAYLDLAEDRAERHIPMTMEDWSKRLDLFYGFILGLKFGARYIKNKQIIANI